MEAVGISRWNLKRGRDASWARPVLWDERRNIVELVAPVAPKVCELLEAADEDLTAFYAYPREHWTKLRSTNPLERVNKEIGRRADVVGIFPNDASVIRWLAGSGGRGRARTAGLASLLGVNLRARAGGGGLKGDDDPGYGPARSQRPATGWAVSVARGDRHWDRASVRGDRSSRAPTAEDRAVPRADRVNRRAAFVAARPRAVDRVEELWHGRYSGRRRAPPVFAEVARTPRRLTAARRDARSDHDCYSAPHESVLPERRWSEEIWLPAGYSRSGTDGGQTLSVHRIEIRL
jgi:hypothetical protein